MRPSDAATQFQQRMGHCLEMTLSPICRVCQVHLGRGPATRRPVVREELTVDVEPDPIAARLARERFGLEVYNDLLERVGLSSLSFDAITMNHVIEHIHDIIANYGGVVYYRRVHISNSGH
jgi:hypothetical protein